MAYTTIDNPELYFQIKLYTGDASSTSHTLDGDENMQPDLAWFKSRSRTDNSRIVDALRTTYSIKSNTTGAEVDSGSDGFTSLDADGFTLNGSGGGGEFNASSGTYVVWCWKAGTTASGTTTGSGTGKSYSSSYNSTSGFQITAYTGNGSAGHTIPVGLSSAPNFVICKTRASGSFIIYHSGNTSAPETDYLEFDTGATTDNNGAWNDVAPTSSAVTLGTFGDLNTNDQTNIMYAWHNVQGFSKFGSYVGNANVDGNFVYLGFRPALVIVKKASATDNWFMFDNKREGYNNLNDALRPNLDNGELNLSGVGMDLLSNGFKLRSSDDDLNDSNTFIYMAWAEAPFVNSNGVPCNAR